MPPKPTRSRTQPYFTRLSEPQATQGADSDGQTQRRPGRKKRKRASGSQGQNHGELASRQTFKQGVAQDNASAHYGNVTYNAPVYYDSMTSTPRQSYVVQEGVDVFQLLVKDVLDSLRFGRMDERYLTITMASTSTCAWILATDEVNNWKSRALWSAHHGFFWIKGKPGAGKSTMMRYIFDEATTHWNTSSTISFFFHARGQPLERNVEGLYRSLLVQLFEKIPDLPGLLGARFSRPEGGSWSVGRLKQLFAAAVTKLNEVKIETSTGIDRRTDGTVICFIDALDECDEAEVRDLVELFEELGEKAAQKTPRFWVCFASRHYPCISIAKKIELVLERQKGHESDIEHYIDSKLRICGPQLQHQLKTALLKKASGVFLWVALASTILQRDIARGHFHSLVERLEDIPSELSELFNDILTRNVEDIEAVILTLQWILHAERPLTCEELYYAILSGLQPDAVTLWNHDVLTREDMLNFILDCSRGLAELTKGSQPVVQFIHESVRSYLSQEDSLRMLEPLLIGRRTDCPHELLRDCCNMYIGLEEVADFASTVLSEVGSPSRSPSRSKDYEQISWLTYGARKRICEEISQAYPFIKYAIRGIMHHADRIASQDRPQVEFLEALPLRSWTFLANIFQRKQGYHYMDARVSRLYVFALEGMFSLLATEIKRDATVSMESQRHHTALGAAAFRSDRRAVQLLLEQGEHSWRPKQTQYYDDLLCYDDLLYYDDLLANGAKDLDMLVSILQHVPHLSLPSLRVAQKMIQLLAPGVITEQSAVLVLTRIDWRNHAHLGHSFVSMAIQQDATGFLQKIFARVTGPDHISSRHGGLWLAAAAQHGRQEIIELLLALGVEVDYSEEDPSPGAALDTALYQAMAHGHQDIVQLLFEKGADINRPSGADNNTVLHLATRKWGVSSITTEHDGSPHAPPYPNWHIQLQDLLRRGADVNSTAARVRNPRKTTVLMMAAGAGDLKLVGQLLKRGADCNAQGGPSNGTALHAACGQQHKEVVQLLLDAGANVDVQKASGGTALQIACHRGHDDIARLLLAGGADLGLPCGGYQSALHAAANQGNTSTVKLLLDQGNSVVRHVPCALKAASWEHHGDVVRLLEQALMRNTENEPEAGAEAVEAAIRTSSPGSGLS